MLKNYSIFKGMVQVGWPHTDGKSSVLYVTPDKIHFSKAL